MKLLLDTHVLLWWLDDPAKLSAAARQAISDRSNDVLISAAVAWEIAIKRGLGKLSAPADLESAILGCGFRTLPISFAHAMATERLALQHRDPFDRILVAQSLAEDATLVSRDPALTVFGISMIVA